MSLENKIKDIDRLQEKINSYGTFPEEVKKKINYKFRLDWNYYSNSMEGGTLTKEETRSVMIGNIDIHNKPIKDVFEMRGHDEVVNNILRIGKGEQRLSEKRIKEIHKLIIHEEDPEKKKLIGEWKTKTNEIINYRGEKFEFVAPHEVRERMHQLLDKTNAAIDAIYRGDKKCLHPVMVALQFHLEYVSIHPFYDGNGRTARVLTNLILIAFGYPPFIVKDAEKDRYNQLLADIQGYGGNPDLFYELLTDLVIRSQEMVLDALEGKDIDEVDDIDKRLSMINRLLEDVEDEIQLTKNENTVSIILDNVIEPLYHIFYNKAVKLAPLFNSIDFTCFVDGSGNSHKNIDDLLINLRNRIEARKIHIQNITLKLKLDKFKKLGINAFDIWEDLKIELHDHKYKVSWLGNKYFEKLYHQRLNEAEFIKITNDIINVILQEIEEKVDKRST